MQGNKQTVYVTGGTGFIGSNLIRAWLTNNKDMFFYIQTRDKEKVKGLIADLQNNRSFNDVVNRIVAVSSFLEVDKDIDLLVNLAGAPIADARWTEKQKSLLRNSRINFTENLILDIKKSGKRIGAVIQASAVGFYGFSSRQEEPCNETVAAGEGFSAKLCKDWELSAQNFFDVSDRLVIMRLGVVLGDGGVLKKLMPLFKIGVGGPIGDGSQAFPWIHINDVVNGILYLVENDSVTGVVNFVAPETLSQREFATAFGKSLNRPSFMKTPGFVMKMAYGEMAEELLLGGCSVSCERLAQHGYNFKFAKLSSALK